MWHGSILRYNKESANRKRYKTMKNKSEQGQFLFVNINVKRKRASRVLCVG